MIDPLADRYGVTVSYLMGWSWPWDDDEEDADEMSSGDWAEQRATLHEASAQLREWSERLPRGSSWRWTFGDIGRLVGEGADGPEGSE